MNTQKSLMDFLCKNFMVEEDEIDMETSLIDQGIIDSFGLIEISAFIEQKTGVKVRKEQMIRENFGSFNKLIIFMEKLGA
jgi:acyl carrier protein